MLHHTELRITEEGLKNSSTNIIPPETVVISTRVGLGKVVITKDFVAINQDLKGLLIKGEIEVKYLFYWLKSQSEFLKSSGTGATVKGVKLDFIKNLSCPLPSLKEQKYIIEKIDALFACIDTAIEYLQESVTLANALFESSQNDIFNDVLSKYHHCTIDDICTVTSSKRIFKADYVESGIPFYRTKEIVDLSKEKNLSTELFIDTEKYSEISEKFGVPKKGDLLFSAVGTIGVMWIVDERECYFKDGNLLWLKDMNGVTPEYLKSAISAVLTRKLKIEAKAQHIKQYQ